MPHPQYMPSPEARERLLKKRGNLQPFASFDPTRTALLVIDMQMFYLGRMTHGRVLIPRINDVARRLRNVGGRVAWVQMTLPADLSPDCYGVYHRNFFTPENAKRQIEALSPGGALHRIHEDLDVESQDLVIEKRFFGAFSPGSSTGEQRLRDLGIDNLLISGVMTNTCCESTAREAAVRDFRVAILSDCTAAWSDEVHLASLSSLHETFANVMESHELFDSQFLSGA